MIVKHYNEAKKQRQEILFPLHCLWIFSVTLDTQEKSEWFETEMMFDSNLSSLSVVLFSYTNIILP